VLPAPRATTARANTTSVGTNIDVNVDTPENFGFGSAGGQFTANAKAYTVTTSGDSSATAIGARGGRTGLAIAT